MNSNQSYFIYILWSGIAKKYYLGYTQDVKRRIFQHNNSSFNSFTAKYRPWKYIAHFKVMGSKEDAIRIERFIKAQKSKKFIESLIESQSFSGKLSLLVRVPKLRD